MRGVGAQSVVLGTVGPGEFVGEMAVLEGRARSATVRALEEVSAERISRKDFLSIISEDSEQAHRLILRLSERLRLTDEKLADAPRPSTPAAAEPRSEGTFRVTLLPGSERIAAHLPEAGLAVTDLPFRVGRKPAPHEDQPTGDVELALQDAKPYRLSRRHFAIEQSGEDCIVRDLSSHLGTIVNGESLGDQFAHDRRALAIGENEIIAGGLNADFAFRLRLGRPG